MYSRMYASTCRRYVCMSWNYACKHVCTYMHACYNCICSVGVIHVNVIAACFPVCAYACMYVFMNACMSVCLCAYMCLLVRLSFCMFVGLCVSLSVCVCVCLSLSPCVCLSVRLFAFYLFACFGLLASLPVGRPFSSGVCLFPPSPPFVSLCLSVSVCLCLFVFVCLCVSEFCLSDSLPVCVGVALQCSWCCT